MLAEGVNPRRALRRAGLRRTRRKKRKRRADRATVFVSLAASRCCNGVPALTQSLGLARRVWRGSANVGGIPTRESGDEPDRKVRLVASRAGCAAEPSSSSGSGSREPALDGSGSARAAPRSARQRASRRLDPRASACRNNSIRAAARVATIRSARQRVSRPLDRLRRSSSARARRVPDRAPVDRVVEQRLLEHAPRHLIEHLADVDRA